MLTQSKAVALPPRIPRTANLLRALLKCGWVRALGQEFFSDKLAHLYDALQEKDVLVEVAVDPDDLSRAFVFDPLRLLWIETPNLYARPTRRSFKPRASPRASAM